MKQAKPFDYWIKKNNYYHTRMIQFLQFVVPKNAKVLQVNCKNGYLLDSVKPIFGVGIDENKEEVKHAKEKYPHLTFYSGTIESLEIQKTFDYIILISATMETEDIQTMFKHINKFCHRKTRIVIDTYTYAWEPILWISQKLGLKRPTNFKNWVSRYDLENFLYLEGFETVTKGHRMLMPIYMPLLSSLLNSFIAKLPLIRRLCLHEWIIARPIPKPKHDTNKSVSVIIPCKNEKGNVEQAVLRCPQMGTFTELIFVEGGSNDGTLEEIKKIARKYPDRNISWIRQDKTGKGEAVQKGFKNAKGDILMILDADLTVPPEELPKFFDALICSKGDLINGSRLVYGMESSAMRHLNIFVNFCFSLILTWLIDQKIKDTLCGTKVLFKQDYEKIAANRSYFGNFDPFGDFDLLFGAAKLNLKIVDMPVHYKKRLYGRTKIPYYRCGVILLVMSFIAFKKFKLR